MSDNQHLSETAVTIGEMREFMRHTRQQVDGITVTLKTLAERQGQHADQQTRLVERQSELCRNMKALKTSVDTLVMDGHTRKVSMKSKVVGATFTLAGIGVLGAVLSGDVATLIASLKTFLSVVI